MTFLDLSVVLNDRTPVYPADSEIQIISTGTFDQDGYNDHVMRFGTHVDAPYRMLKNGRPLNTYPIERFVGKGKYIKVTNEFKIDDIKSAQLGAGDIVLFETGASKYYHEARYFTDYPVMSQTIAKYLVSQGVSMVGIDTCSPDNQDDFPIHKTLLAGDVLIIKNLTNLTALKGSQCMVYALPLKVKLDASPARVIAVAP